MNGNGNGKAKTNGKRNGKHPPMPPNPPTCPGHNLLTTQPCSRAAGFGTDHPGVGGCLDHDEAAVAKVQEVKKAFLDAFSTGTVAMAVAATSAGKDLTTIWRYRQLDPEFDAAVIEAQQQSDALRTSMVEDSLFSRVVGGRASPAETIFWLKNRAPDRWKDVQQHRLVGLLGVAHRVAGMSDAELERLMSAPDEHIAGLLSPGEMPAGMRLLP